MEKNEHVTATLGKSEYAKVTTKKNGHANGNGVVRGASADLRAGLAFSLRCSTTP